MISRLLQYQISIMITFILYCKLQHWVHFVTSCDGLNAVRVYHSALTTVQPRCRPSHLAPKHTTVYGTLLNYASFYIRLSSGGFGAVERTCNPLTVQEMGHLLPKGANAQTLWMRWGRRCQDMRLIAIRIWYCGTYLIDKAITISLSPLSHYQKPP